MGGFLVRWVRWVRFASIACLAFVLLALLIGTGYQHWAQRRDLRTHPAPGQLVDVAGHRLHLWCIGEGAPVVVLETGAGGSSLQWNRVQPEVARATRVCAYDRAGLGWSDLGPTPRTAARIVDELHILLETAGVPGPYVLTGHSGGGLYARLYVSTYPTDVAGMVLVEASHEDQRRRMPTAAGAGPVNPLVLHFRSFLTVVGFASDGHPVRRQARVQPRCAHALRRNPSQDDVALCVRE